MIINEGMAGLLLQIKASILAVGRGLLLALEEKGGSSVDGVVGPIFCSWGMMNMCEFYF